ncbi:MAG: bifunctional phosphoglucose/phosphomannose isomerase [Euryarchaeota archaeon RBG_16_62_10]|nr:MAG: bifunctional phosphoglucose/phosphomannose isomerase [Euryarchaeota archaeon RBG_16_62_10]
MLDSKGAVKSLDRKDMLGVIEAMPRHLADGVRRGRVAGPPRFAPRNVFVCGLGGSAIGGDLLCGWLSTCTDIPATVVRSYDVPAHASKDSLVIVASYSGNTEETISMYEDARRKGAKIVAIASGGLVAQMSEKYGVPFARVPSGLVPRASLGYVFGAMLGIVELSGLAESGKQLEEALRVLNDVIATSKPAVQTADNPAKKMAHQLFGHIPVVVGYTLSRPVAKRWANQINENAKSMAFSSELPEMDHNEIVGWMKDPRSKGFSVVLLEHGQQTSAMSKRLIANSEMLSRAAPVHTVFAKGLSPLARMFSLVAMGDYVSVYLALLCEQDPSTTEPIEELKAVLAKK